MNFTERLEALGKTAAELMLAVDEMKCTPEEVLDEWERDVLPRSAWLEVANMALGLKGRRGLTDFIEEYSDETRYLFVGCEGRSSVTPKQLVEFRYAQPAIMVATGVLVATIPKSAWQVAVRHLLRARTVNELGAEASREGRGRRWVMRYLGSHYYGPHPFNPEHAWITDEPVWKDGDAYIVAGQIKKSVLIHDAEHVSDVELGRTLHAAGLTPVALKVRTAGGKRTTKSYWRVPPELNDHSEEPKSRGL